MIKQITRRLKSGQDLKAEIEHITKKEKIHAGCLLSVVGGLRKASLRMPGGKTIKTWRKDFEIIGGTGTISQEGCHIHLAISDKTGKVLGGHLERGSIIRLTAEVVLLLFNNVGYSRKFDKETGHRELKVIY